MRTPRAIRRLASWTLRSTVCLIGWWLSWHAGSGDAAAQNSRPNILLAIADDWSYGHASAYGCTWVETPGFDRVARQGLLFTRAYTPNAKCAPSRACLLTGRNSWQLKDACNHVCYFPTEFKTYAETLAEHGYRVGLTGKGWGPGEADDAEGRPRAIAGTPVNRHQTQPPAKAMSNNDYAANFAQFLESVPDQQPWCFWYGALEPHRGYEFGAGVAKAGKQLSDIRQVPSFWPDDETVRNDMLDYALEVEYFDRHLQRMLEHLEQQGQLENTIVVVTSDHGMPFPRCKGQAYDSSNHVPLAIMWARGIKQPGRVVEQYVSNIDLAPTFIQLAGLDWQQTGMAPSPGRSLADVFATSDPVAGRDFVLIGKERHDVGRPMDGGYPIRGLLRGDFLYLRNYEPDRWPAGNPETGYLNTDGSPTKTLILEGRTASEGMPFWQLCFGKRPAEELYDVRKDPDCVANLAADAQFESKKQAMQLELQTRLEQQQDPRALGNGEYFDQIPYANRATRNFYERFLRGEDVRAGWINQSDIEPAPLD